MALSDGEGLVFLHGAGSRGQLWQLQLLAFPRAFAPDLPGRTDPLVPAAADQAGVDVYLQALREYLARAHPASGSRVVAGHSLGGAIALWWALQHPEEVQGLILIGTGARLRVTPSILEGVKAGDAAVIEQFGAMWFAPQTSPRLREKSLALLRATPPAVLSADLTAANEFDVMREIDRLALPTLILCGAEDRLAPVKFSQYLHQHIRDSELVIVPEAGHMVMIEQPRPMNDAIRGFLRRLDGGAES